MESETPNEQSRATNVKSFLFNFLLICIFFRPHLSFYGLFYRKWDEQRAAEKLSSGWAGKSVKLTTNADGDGGGEEKKRDPE